MYRQVLSEAPGIDVIVRDEGETVLTELIRCKAEGRWPTDRRKINGLAFMDSAEIVATLAAATVKDVDGIDPDWTILDLSKNLYTPLGVQVAIPNMARSLQSGASHPRRGEGGDPRLSRQSGFAASSSHPEIAVDRLAAVMLG